jgi:hypothetical protein
MGKLEGWYYITSTKVWEGLHLYMPNFGLAFARVTRNLVATHDKALEPMGT